MKSMFVMILGLALLTGCGGDSNDAAVADANLASVAQDAQAPAPSSAAAGTQGEVLETMNSGGYTYARISTPEGDVWAAAPETQLAVGDIVENLQGMPMPNFESKTLGRTFDEILFVNAFTAAGGAAPAAVQAELTRAHAGIATGAADGEAIDVQAADGGITVAGIHALGAKADGYDVVLRGKVVKANFGILGTNWYHIQDGSGAEGANDLTITSAARIAVGDVVLVKGKLATDRDFGAGYVYKLIVEDAEVVVDAM